MDTLVSTDWLSQHIGDSDAGTDLVILDCTVCTVFEEGGGLHNISGRADYESGHIPNAGFADLKGDLCDQSNPVEFSLPTPEQFCSAMGKLGVGDDTRVVLYDTKYSAWAARVWWMLRWVGFDNAAILDGGLGAWKSEGRPLSVEPALHSVKQFTPNPRPELIADRDEVLSAIDDENVYLIDTLPEEFYRGEATIYARPGHIPGAMNINGLNLLDESGHYRHNDELLAMHEDYPDSRIITYCGGGIVASSNAFIMTRLGFTNVAVYTASLQEWAADPANPMVVDSE